MFKLNSSISTRCFYHDHHRSCPLPWFHFGLKALGHLHQLERVDLLHSDKDSNSQIWNTFWFLSLLYVQGRSRKTALPVTLKMNVFLRVGHILKLQFRHYRASVDYHKDNIPQNPAIFQRLCNEVGSRSLSRLFTVGKLTQHGASKH